MIPKIHIHMFGSSFVFILKSGGWAGPAQCVASSLFTLWRRIALRSFSSSLLEPSRKSVISSVTFPLRPWLPCSEFLVSKEG